MNEKDIKSLISIADKLDLSGNDSLANRLDTIIAKIAKEEKNPALGKRNAETFFAIVNNYPEAAAMLAFSVSTRKYSGIGHVGWYYPFSKVRFEPDPTVDSGLEPISPPDGESDPHNYVLDKLSEMGYMVATPSSTTVTQKSLDAAQSYIRSLPPETANARHSDETSESSEANDAADGFDANKLSADFSLYKGFVRR